MITQKTQVKFDRSTLLKSVLINKAGLIMLVKHIHICPLMKHYRMEYNHLHFLNPTNWIHKNVNNKTSNQVHLQTNDAWPFSKLSPALLMNINYVTWHLPSSSNNAILTICQCYLLLCGLKFVGVAMRFFLGFFFFYTAAKQCNGIQTFLSIQIICVATE